jgi:GNAT superfamily N-acetyltransferase
MDEAAVEVREITAEETSHVRRVMLRTGTPSTSVEFAGDDDARTCHLGAFLGDRLVGVSTWRERDADGVRRVQLRAMAVLDDVQGRGVGRLLVADGVRRAREAGAAEVWANARDTALTFYQQCGFVVEGDGFVTPDTALPHHRIRLTL